MDYFKAKYSHNDANAANPPKRGMDSVTVPGAVASWVVLSERFGKLPFADLMQPAVLIAETDQLHVARNAVKRISRDLPFAIWMALAKAASVYSSETIAPLK